jgi:hypothetical protein
VTTGDNAFWQTVAESLAEKLAHQQAVNVNLSDLLARLQHDHAAREAERDQLVFFRDRWRKEAFAVVCDLVEVESILNTLGTPLGKGVGGLAERVEQVRERCLVVVEGKRTTHLMRNFVSAAVAVARLNFDQADSIRPRTNGAVDAFHALENALLSADLADVPDSEYAQRIRASFGRKEESS